jgi:hypothetical protein
MTLNDRVEQLMANTFEAIRRLQANQPLDEQIKANHQEIQTLSTKNDRLSSTIAELNELVSTLRAASESHTGPPLEKDSSQRQVKPYASPSEVSPRRPPKPDDLPDPGQFEPEDDWDPEQDGIEAGQAAQLDEIRRIVQHPDIPLMARKRILRVLRRSLAPSDSGEGEEPEAGGWQFEKSVLAAQCTVQFDSIRRAVQEPGVAALPRKKVLKNLKRLSSILSDDPAGGEAPSGRQGEWGHAEQLSAIRVVVQQVEIPADARDRILNIVGKDAIGQVQRQGRRKGAGVWPWICAFQFVIIIGLLIWLVYQIRPWGKNS